MTNKFRAGSLARHLAHSAAFLALVSVAGCFTDVDRNVIVGSIPQSYRDVHPITIGEQLSTFDVPVGQNSAHLTPAALANINGFAGDFMRSGSTMVAIVAPNGAANDIQAARIAGEVEYALINSGIPPSMIDHRVYQASPAETGAPVRLAFARINANVGPCGLWSDQATDTSENRNMANFGCSTQTNFAAVLDNPLDLLYPRGMTPVSPERRVAVLQGYRDGEAYQSDYGRARATDADAIPISDVP
ncbi:MAG: CpaD family pilus assembly protein [Bauldia sp.]|nr:CpaD family pilus assembly protein [Bauldia sp.]